MRKMLVLVALIASGFVFADGPVSPQTQPSTTMANKSKPVEVKKTALNEDTKSMPPKPRDENEKPTVKLCMGEKTCPCPTDGKGMTGKKEEAKTEQMPAKTNAPKIALA